MILLFNMVPKQSAEVQSSVSMGKKAMMCLTEKAPVLDGLRSDLRYSAVGQSSSGNESTIYGPSSTYTGVTSQ